MEEASELAEQILFSPSRGRPTGSSEVLARVKKEFSLADTNIDKARKEKFRLRGDFFRGQGPGRSFPCQAPFERNRFPLGPSLLLELARCRRADLAVAFLKKNAVESLRPAIREALWRGARIRILTTDYLDATDPVALEILLAIGEDSGGTAGKNGVDGTLDIRCHIW